MVEVGRARDPRRGASTEPILNDDPHRARVGQIAEYSAIEGGIRASVRGVMIPNASGSRTGSGDGPRRLGRVHGHRNRLPLTARRVGERGTFLGLVFTSPRTKTGSKILHGLGAAPLPDPVPGAARHTSTSSGWPAEPPGGRSSSADDDEKCGDAGPARGSRLTRMAGSAGSAK